jgi:hypothetical protein
MKATEKASLAYSLFASAALAVVLLTGAKSARPCFFDEDGKVAQRLVPQG